MRLWPDHEMPVVWHDAIRENPKRLALAGELEYPLKRFVVRRLCEQRQAANRAVEHVVDGPALDGSASPGHVTVSNAM